MSDTDPTTAPATTIGRYRVVRLIAHGGMGSLYLARDPAIDRLVAIKLMKSGFDDDVARERFAREARATGGLRHPNIVTVFDVGEHHNRPFIAMEYVPGETLAELIRRRAPLLITERLAILEDLCAGLHFAHLAGILHRDIKPANVIVDVTGSLKILDFGLARDHSSNITQSGDQLGTLNYMSPEQVVGDRLDQRSDVYAVGAVAYELVSCKKAFSGTVPDGAMFKILNTRPEPLETVVPGIDPEIATIIERAMARDPGRRYQDLEALRLDLSAVRTRLHTLQPEALAPRNDDGATRIEAPGPSLRIQSLTPTPGKASRGRGLADVIRDPSSRDRGALASLGDSLPTASSGNAAAGRHAREPSARSTVEPREENIEKISPDSRAADRRRVKRFLLFGAGAVALLAILAVAFNRNGSSARPPDPAVAAAPPAAQPAPPAANGAGTTPDRAEGPNAIDQHVSSMRATARRQISLGQLQQALDTLSAGLVLAVRDPEFQRLIEDLMRTARQTAAQERLAASGRGATEDSSIEFRDGLAREREADVLARLGDRAPAIRSFWAAAALYDRAGRVLAQSVTPSPAPAAVPKPVPEVPKTEAAPIASERPVTPSPTAPDSPRTPPATTEKTPPAPVAVKPEPPAPTVGDAVPDGRALDTAAIRETLRRYAEAYQSREMANVRKVMPSLDSQQLRNLERDFSNYRSYTVDISGPRIVVDNVTATVTCTVRRSFVTRGGIAGGNTVNTIFHLRKADGVWSIERLESR